MRWLLRPGPSVVATAIGLAFAAGANGQVLTDGSLGARTRLVGPDHLIGAELGRLVGANLFHSFLKFNLDSGQSATFSGPGGVANVISRVTGGNTSHIDGLIRSTIAGANLYLINPKGIVFGPNARLDLSGSFHAASADYLRLADGALFQAVPAAGEVLTSAAPEAFGFLGSDPGPIRVRGSEFDMAPGSALNLAGGKLELDAASVLTRGADIRLTSLAGPAELPVSAATPVPAGVASGRVEITGGSLLTTVSNAGIAQPAGKIVIRGGRLALRESTLASENFSAMAAGAIDLTAERGAVLQDMLVSSRTSDAGRGADIRIAGGRVRIDGGQLETITEWTGDAGAIELRGRDVVVDRGAWVRSQAEAGSTGNTGGIMLAGERRVVVRGKDAFDNFSAVNTWTAGAGDAGPITIEASTVRVAEGIVGTTTFGPGNSGRVAIRGQRVSLLEGAYVYADADAGSIGRGGEVTIDAEGAFTLSGVDSFGAVGQVSASTGGAGDAGSVRVRADSILVEGGARIESRAFAGSTGRAGDILLSGTSRVEVRGHDPSITQFSTLAASSQGAKGAGTIVVNGGDIVLDQAVVNASSQGAGDAGRIVLDGGEVGALHGTLLNTSARDSSRGGGGAIEIRARGLFELSGTDVAGARSSIESTTRDRDGGDIAISADRVLVSGAKIAATVEGSGNGGAIRIDARSTEVLSAAKVSTETSAGSSGHGGRIEIAAREGLVVRGTASAISTVLTDTSGSGRAGDIAMSGRDVIIDNARVGANSNGSGATGHIELTGERIELVDGIVSVAAVGTRGGGSIRVSAAESLLLRGDGNDGLGSAILGLTTDSGRGADIAIEADRVTLRNGEIAARTLGPGDAGSVAIVTGDLLLERGGAIAASSERGGTGNAGSIDLTASRSIVVQGVNPAGLESEISTSTTGPGHAGSMRLRAPSVRFDGGLAFSETSASGNAGDIVFDVGRLEIVNGGQISANTLAELGSAPFGRGGNVTVNATDAVLVSGFDAAGFVSSIRTQTRGDGIGGNIAVRAPSIRIDDSALVVASTQGSGHAGNVTLEATDHIAIATRGRVAADSLFAAGAGGDVFLGAPLVTLTAGGKVSAAASGSGPGGSIRIEGARIAMNDGGNVSSSALGAGDAGSIALVATDSITLGEPLPAAVATTAVEAAADGTGRGGSILLQAPSVRVGFEAAVIAGTTDRGLGGDIRVIADRLEVAGGISAAADADGDAGSIDIRARDLHVQTHAGRHGHIGTDAFEAGSAGNIQVQLTGTLLNEGFISAATVDGPGAGGNIDIRADAIDLRYGSNISATTFGSGNAGAITLKANDITIRSQAGIGEGVLSNTAGSGDAGAIDIAASRVRLVGGGTISTIAFAGISGNAGSINVTATDSIEVSGRGRLGYPSLVSSTSLGDGRGGSVALSAPSILLDEGLVQARAAGAGAAGSVVVRAGTLDLRAGGRLDTSVTGAGAGGQIDVIADRVVMHGVEAAGPFLEYVSLATPSGVLSTTTGSGPGGNIRIEAPRVAINSGAQVSASSEGLGTAGSIEIVTADRLTLTQGAIRTDARESDGGNIGIQAGNRLHLIGSEISTSVGGGAGSGGNITIDPVFVILQDSRIAANAFGGAGGNISIVADYFLISPDSTLDASSRLGVPGSVRIDAVRTDASSQLRALPAQFFDASGLLKEACAGRWQTGASRLVEAGRGGVAQLPFSYAGSTYFSAPGGAATSERALRGSGSHEASVSGDQERMPSGAASSQSVLLAGICGS